MREGRDRRRLPGRRVFWCLALGLLTVPLVVSCHPWLAAPSREDAPAVAAREPTSRQPSKPPESRPSGSSTRTSPAERGRGVEELRSRLPEISGTNDGTHGVIVFDPVSGESAALNADRTFIAASLSKMYALLTLYRAAGRGEVDLEDEITMLPSDVWAYGTGVLYRYPPGRTMTLRECATFLIKESDNTAEVMLHRYLGEETIEAELRALGAHSTSYWEPNTTTPSDILLVLKAIADPSYTSPELSEEMLDIMTNTSFEDRLTGPLPEGTRVAHKIGSYESTFSDAGIVFPSGETPGETSEGNDRERDAAGGEYYVVAFAEDVSENGAKEAIGEFSLAAYRALGDAEARESR